MEPPGFSPGAQRLLSTYNPRVTSPSRATVVLVLILAAWATLSAQIAPDAIQGARIEQFLTTAKVKSMKDIGDGITNPKKTTLELNGVRHFAVFKTIDVNAPGIVPAMFGGNTPNFQDSWRTEVAAYERQMSQARPSVLPAA